MGFRIRKSTFLSENWYKNNSS